MAAVNAASLEGAGAVLAGRSVLNDVSLTIAPGEVVALVGPNGAGKSSVLKALAGVLPLTSGRASLGGQPLDRLSPRRLAAQVAYLAQDRRIAWNMAAVEIVALGAPFAGSEDAHRRAVNALAEVGMAHLTERGVADMSGGERGRVLLARALVPDVPLLLADEPTAGLDPDAQLMVLDLLRARARRGQAILISLHDLGLAARYADRVVVMHRGCVAADDQGRSALSDAVLSTVFGVSGRWLDGADGAVLELSRRQG